MRANGQKIGLTISGGGAKGVAALAIIEELINKGVKFSAISGTSVGAIIGGYLAIHGEVTSLRTRLLEMSSIDWMRMLDFGFRGSATLLKGDKFRTLYKDLYGDVQFSDLKTPLFVTATDLQNGVPYYINEGSLYDAITASSAYPGVFPPLVLKGKPFADGGILDNLPYEILLKSGMDKVIVINLLTIIKDTKENFDSMRALISRTVELLMANALNNKKILNPNVFVYTPVFENSHTGTFKLHKIKKYYESGLSIVEKESAHFESWLNAPTF